MAGRMVSMKSFGKVFLSACLLVVLASCASNDCIKDRHAQIEVAFGPEAGAEALVLKAIASAKQSIRLSAYALSSPAIIQALIAVKQRGVEVAVVVDYGHNVIKDSKGIGRDALNTLVQAGVVVRTNDSYRKMHDKFIIIDGKHVQTGSYNYAKSANKNSENVLVVWDDPTLAERYLKHWQSRFDGGAVYSIQQP